MMNAKPSEALSQPSSETSQSDPGSDRTSRIQKALAIARVLQLHAVEYQTKAEKRRQSELDRLIRSQKDKATLIQLTDQVFRSQSPAREMNQLLHILSQRGIPQFFDPPKRFLLRMLQSFGRWIPSISVPLTRNQMRRDAASVVIPATPLSLKKHLNNRTSEGIRVNINLLGEAILGEHEANLRIQRYLEYLEQPEVETLSIKISTLYSQISSIAWEKTVQILSDRLAPLYQFAEKQRYRHPNGREGPKFIYLDMESYRDLNLTVEAFTRTLSRPGMERIAAGLALQAYIPDSYEKQQQVTRWAKSRIRQGGAPITIRIVKGANMEMERIEASLQGWPQAPFKSKRETDAHFKRMLHQGVIPENLRAVRLGVASHNLFDLAYALVLIQEQRLEEGIQFEMLEGMASHQQRALHEWHQNLLLYSPLCHPQDFVHAMGYLVRRLDENSGPDNFLRHVFNLSPETRDWRKLESAFIDSLIELEKRPPSSRRRQNRQIIPSSRNLEVLNWRDFRNEPDTDFSIPINATWAADILRRWQTVSGEAALEIPLVVGGQEIEANRPTKPCFDPSRPGVVIGRYRQANKEDLNRAVSTAREDLDGWRKRSPSARSETLSRVAQEIRKHRADLIGAAVADGGKTILEADSEVSEAIDFLEFYRLSAHEWYRLPAIEAAPKGVVIVVSPWNFPIAIPCGGIAAALAAGNTVLLKPASDAVLVAWKLCQCFWQAGISKRTLQFIPCDGAIEGAALVTRPDIDAVILTGGTSTALHLLRQKPDLQLAAETGGKNGTIITALADRDQAIEDLIQSAFSHSGQKCSATSLLLLEDEVYRDPQFKQSLCDAVGSLPVGSAWDLSTRIGPLIRPPTDALKRALGTLDPGESWALTPECRNNNPHLWTPGIKWGIQPGSPTHQTELFGPVLGVMPYRKLSDAIEIINQTGYGLTAGIASLDEREQEEWKRGIRAGNLYINRPTTGAIVLRQPFGGLGKSAFGAGFKAGGPNYLAQLMTFTPLQASNSRFRIQPSPAPAHPNHSDPQAALQDDQSLWFQRFHRGLLNATRRKSSRTPPHEDLHRLGEAGTSYHYYWRNEFKESHDHFKLIGQDNLRAYLPREICHIRLHQDDTFFDIAARICAARTVGCKIVVSYPFDGSNAFLAPIKANTHSWSHRITFRQESDEEFEQTIRRRLTSRVRYAAPNRVPQAIWAASADSGIYVAAAPVLPQGRVELLWYLREQSLSHNYHRYGNLGARAGELRSDTL